MIRIGLIGNGSIARTIVNYCDKNNDKYQIIGALGLPSDTKSHVNFPIFLDLNDLIKCDPHLIIECASQEAVLNYSIQIINLGIDLILISVGALVEENFFNDLLLASNKAKSKLIIPSGALAGLDAISSARKDGISKVHLRTTKPPTAWDAAVGFNDKKIINTKKPKVIFKGNARNAALAFPKNANVAAALAIAGIGVEKTTVELIADPKIKKNKHQVEVEGEFGSLSIIVEANPSKENPKTSHLAALSIIRQLEKLTENFII